VKLRMPDRISAGPWVKIPPLGQNDRGATRPPTPSLAPESSPDHPGHPIDQDRREPNGPHRQPRQRSLKAAHRPPSPFCGTGTILRLGWLPACERTVASAAGPCSPIRRAAGGIAWAIYFTTSGRRIVVLHAFEKRAQRTPRRSLDLASGIGHGRSLAVHRGDFTRVCAGLLGRT
jgi:hypothetical protein